MVVNFLSVILIVTVFTYALSTSTSAYILKSTAVAIPFWILFNIFDQLIFFEPIWIFYLPEDAITG
ncbi:MAG: hypothetical protein ACRD8Z_25955, partial [Nitrososphaeraceae archaeon]